MSETLLEVKNLKQYFNVRTDIGRIVPLKAVDDVSFDICRGETLGLVGESGCGKTTVGRTILRLYEPTAGQILFDGEEVTRKNITRMRKQMQMVFVCLKHLLCLCTSVPWHCLPCLSLYSVDIHLCIREYHLTVL